MTQFTLSSRTQAAITAALQSPGTNNVNYLNTYNDIAADIAAHPGVNSGTYNWFSQDGRVNTYQTNPTAQGAYIWNYTEAAAKVEGATVTTPAKHYAGRRDHGHTGPRGAGSPSTAADGSGERTGA